MLKRFLLVTLLAGGGALAWSFSPQRLDVAPASAHVLPSIEPPAEIRLGVLQTGTMRSRALFAFRGGDLQARDLAMDVVLVDHPQGRLLIDAGLGARVEAHLETVPLLLRAFSSLQLQPPARVQLEALGYAPGDLKGVLLTHAHWDHVSGLDDLREVPVLISAREQAFIAGGGKPSQLARGFGELRYQVYRFDGGPYAGFAESHDLFGDGSVVLVPAAGHTPGSTIVFVRTPGRDYAFIGDIAWQHEGVDLPAERPWVSRWLVDDDAAAVRAQLVQLHRLQAHSPHLTIVPAHDRRVMASLPRLSPAPSPMAP